MSGFSTEGSHLRLSWKNRAGINSNVLKESNSKEPEKKTSGELSDLGSKLSGKKN
jgi:hypothetical protein